MLLHRVWEYRDIGRLFITAGGEESDNRGAEVGLWVEVILRVSLEVILHHLLRQWGFDAICVLALTFHPLTHAPLSFARPWLRPEQVVRAGALLPPPSPRSAMR